MEVNIFIARVKNDLAGIIIRTFSNFILFINMNEAPLAKCCMNSRWAGTGWLGRREGNWGRGGDEKKIY